MTAATIDDSAIIDAAPAPEVDEEDIEHPDFVVVTVVEPGVAPSFDVPSPLPEGSVVPSVPSVPGSGAPVSMPVSEHSVEQWLLKHEAIFFRASFEAQLASASLVCKQWKQVPSAKQSDIS